MSPANLYADDALGNYPSGGGSTVSLDSDGTLTVDSTTVELATDSQLPAPFGPPIGSAIYSVATGAANNQGTTDNTTGRLIPIEIGAAMTFDALFSRIDVVGGATEVSYFALYRAVLGGLQLVGALDSYAPLSVANFGITLGTPVVVTQPGLHYVVWVNSGSTNTARIRSHSGLLQFAWTHDPATLGVNQAPAVNVADPRPGGVWTTSLTSGFTQVQGANCPLIMLRRSA